MPVAEVTVIMQTAMKPPSSVVAITTLVPIPTATTIPFDTMQTDVFELVQLTFLLAASSGRTVASKYAISPIYSNSMPKYRGGDVSLEGLLRKKIYKRKNNV